MTPSGVTNQQVPHGLLVSIREVHDSLSSLNVGKAIGPDMIPNRVLKDFAPELAPLIMDIYNCSLREGYVSDLLKRSIINPLPKVSPPQEIQSDLRPISLTCTLAKVMEGFARSRLVVQILENLDPRQYARERHSTTDALIYLLQAIHEATDSGNCGARMFFANYSKGFDLIDHSILLRELAFFDIDTVLINWIRAFLTGRSQAVRIGNSLSDWKSPREGIPQGTTLGVILFAVMTNNLLRDWHLRIKFVDDTTALEILPRNGISLLNVAVNDIHKFSVEHNMKLNAKKCKEMLINFMQNDYFTTRPTVLGNNTAECVTTYKLLGIIISNDLKWNEHIDYISKKASKRLYSLRILKKVGVNREGILKVYLTTIRPILEYGVQVCQDIREFLSNKLESIQKRALYINYPCHSYLDALYTTNLSSLKERGTQLCCKGLCNNYQEGG